jgi:hypothetical protein
MNKQEVEYLKKQLLSEKEFYERSLALLDDILINGNNKRVAKIIKDMQASLRVVELKLKSY